MKRKKERHETKITSRNKGKGRTGQDRARQDREKAITLTHSEKGSIFADSFPSALYFLVINRNVYKKHKQTIPDMKVVIHLFTHFQGSLCDD